MPPTIQTGEAERDKRPTRTGERRSELLTKVKYCNTLPDIPFDLKFITYPFPSTRFVQYNPTSLEKSYRYEVLTEHDLGVHIDLINRDIYQGDGNAPLDPADEKLLEDDVLTPQDSKRSRHHAKNVSWLRRSEYISTEATRFQPQSMEKVEAKVGYNVKKIFSEETLYMDRESQIKAIEKTFEDNKRPIEKHYSKPGVTPVEVMPIFPDFDMWKYPCAQVIFDSDPAPADKNFSGQMEAMSQAMIRGVMDESGEQFVAYCLPTEETIQKRRRDVNENIPYMDEDTYEYKMAREYNWNVKSKASKGYEENYFLVVRNHCVYYNELETRVRLSKRRARAGAAAQAPTRLVVTHRPLSSTEHRMLRLREKQLEPPQDEDEEEEEEEDEEEKQEQSGEKERSRSRSKSGSKSPRGSEKSKGSGRSRSPSREKSKSRSRSRSRSRSASGSRNSRSRSGSARSRSPRSGSERSRSRSKSGSRASSRASSKSGAGSRASSASRGSRATSKASDKGSKASSRASSRASKRSSRASSRASRASSRASGSKASSRASSRRNSGSASGSEKSRSRSRSGSKQGSRSGSASSASSRHSGSD
ncbi:RNA polymerase II-associated factor 1 homolog [Bombyx mandarina]|uniref:RNA polymerase II-associated factor 1 homolog n=2 Tax=Bombyx TaxID=7090 RepID=A0A8R2AFQ8_BOMMO|nr:RNA polymerase II-associated factor 1 homolog [Bombyx mori]XP_028026283.1 RNA polymerase II-associated factor 1 homolog [Bombyx mandarina]